MVLGDLIAKFDDEVFANETLISLGDLPLTTCIATIAAQRQISAGELAMQSIGQFVNIASDEDWLTLVGQMSRAENPSAVFLQRVLAYAVST